MAYKRVQTVQITNETAVSLINDAAAAECRSAGNMATLIILKTLAAGTNDRGRDVGSQGENASCVLPKP